ncbi:hypothetical protein KUTeg_002219, partial [Tegillarca granosa]
MKDNSYIMLSKSDLLILVIDVRNVTNPVILFHKTLPNTEMKDIEVCGDFVILARIDDLRTEHGIVEIYGKYDNRTKDLPFKRVIQVGKNPDTLCPTSDCQTILVTIEANAYPNIDATKMIDPPGGVGIIKFPTADLSQEPSFQFADFGDFNNRWQEFVAKGVRYIYRENGNSFANDLEPEGITLNADETIAYVALQTNNAIAELNVNSGTITNIYPLGYKDWRKYGLDASDKDNNSVACRIGSLTRNNFNEKETNIRPWPVYGMYQPDAIKYFVFGGQGYILSANEGATKNYADEVTNGFNEVVRVKDLDFAENSTMLRWAAKNNFTNTSIKQDENIEIMALVLFHHVGRLKVTNTEGKINGTNSTKYQALYSFGARSFSIWRIDASGVVNVYDSGSDIENMMQQLRPELFNSDSSNLDSRLNDSKGLYSSKMGPSPEMVTTGQYKGKTLLFCSCEEPGMVFLYSLDADVTKPKFESMWTGIPKSNTIIYNTWRDLYNQRQISEIDPEDM